MVKLAFLFGLLPMLSDAGSCVRPLPHSIKGSFKDPSVETRPKFRYWLPDASIDASVLKDDIKQLGERGAAGIELLNYFNYGGAQGLPPKEVDWDVYGFATSTYREILQSALEATEDHDLMMDFSMGPQSGQGVPAMPDDIGLSWELVTSNASFEGSYSGLIPGWGSGEFISLSSFDVLNSTITPALTRPEANKTQYTIVGSSLVDLTHLVASNGSLQLSPRLSNASPSGFLHATYARRSYARAAIASNMDPQTILQNGSFAVDHFSIAGAKLTTSFLEKHVIQPNSTIRTLLQNVGQFIWEDSPEIPAGIYWTPDLPARFQEQHGYDMRRYVPLLTGFNGDLMVNDPPISIVSDAPDHALFVYDFRTTLSGCYKEYLQFLGNWSHKYLGMQFSAQVGYNLPIDMLSAIPVVDAPETETLAFLNNIDAFRQFSGPPHLVGQKVVSIELGADYGQAYSQPLTLLIEEASRAYAVGINQVVIHGASYSGNYPQTTYPGFTTFRYLFGAQHSRHQPAWDLGYKAMLDWLARAQFVLQSSTAKVDVIFWNKQTAQDPFPDSLYSNSDLTHAGYSYTYLSPDNFGSPEATVAQGRLAPRTLDAKALILRHNDTLTPFGVKKLAEYAKLGLPIIIQGDVPKVYATRNLSAISSANSTLYSILSLPNVHQVGLGETRAGLASVLAGLDISPRTTVQTNGTWYTRYLASSPNSTVSVFIFSDTSVSTEGTVTIATSGTPYHLDLWNGVESRILEYTIDSKNGGYIIPIRLAAKQATIIQFKQDQNLSSQPLHVLKSSENVVQCAFDASTNSVIAKVGSSTSASTITLSNGSITDLSLPAAVVPQAFQIKNWTLVAEKWIPPSTLSHVEGVVKRNETVQIPEARIPPWSSIPALTNSSGLGIYSATFLWPEANTTDESNFGAILRIPATNWIQGMTVTVNQQSIENVDLFNPVVDISAHLKTGLNVVSIKVSTSLWNSLRPIWKELRTAGASPQLNIESLLANPETAVLAMELPVGLAGAVQIVPYLAVQVA